MAAEPLTLSGPNGEWAHISSRSKTGKSVYVQVRTKGLGRATATVPTHPDALSWIAACWGAATNGDDTYPLATIAEISPGPARRHRAFIWKDGDPWPERGQPGIGLRVLIAYARYRITKSHKRHHRRRATTVNVEVTLNRIETYWSNKPGWEDLTLIDDEDVEDFVIWLDQQSNIHTNTEEATLTTFRRVLTYGINRAWLDGMPGADVSVRVAAEEEKRIRIHADMFLRIVTEFHTGPLLVPDGASTMGRCPVR